MKRITKCLAAILSLMLALALFAACSDKPKEPEKDAEVEAFLACVEDLPATITADEGVLVKIEAAEGAYEVLDTTQRAREDVKTAYTKLQSARSQYDALAGGGTPPDIAAVRQSAINELNAYVDKADYTQKINELNAAIARGTAAINAAETPEAVATALAAAKAEIDDIPTDEEIAAQQAEITSIAVKEGSTHRTEYTETEHFDQTGLTIEATYSNSTKSDLAATDYTITPDRALTTNDQELTVTLKSKPSITTTISITVSAKEKLMTPTAGMLNVDADPTKQTITVNRDTENELSKIKDFAAIKVYVFTSSENPNAENAATTFTITPAFDGNGTFTVTGENYTLERNKQSGQTYQYLGDANIWISRIDVEEILKALLKTDFSYSTTYYFCAQLVAETTSLSADSELGPVSNGWIATPAKVTFNLMGGSMAEGASTTQEVAKGGHATKPTDPTKLNFNFVDWYTSENGGETLSDTPFDFTGTIINEDITLYAKWEPTGTHDKEKLGTVDTTPSDSGNYMNNGSGQGNYTYNRGSSAVQKDDFGTKVDYIKVTLWSTAEKGEQLAQFKITGRGDKAGLIISSLDGTITHFASQNVTDNGYNGVNTTNGFIIGKYFSLFVNLIREKDGKEALAKGTKLYSSFQLIAMPGSDYDDGEESEVCVNADNRTFAMKDDTCDLGGGKGAIIVFVDKEGYANVENQYISVGGTATDPQVQRDGYTLEWYTDEDCTQKFEFGTAITQEMKEEKTGTYTLYAKWVANGAG